MPSKGSIPRTCQQCSTVFLAKASQVNTGNAKYCGRSCLFASMRRQIDRICEWCERSFVIRPSGLKRPARFCGIECHALAKTGVSLPVEQRVLRHIDQRSPDDCWLWTASVDANGYGQVNDGKGRIRKSHQIVLEIKLGRPLAPGELGLHHCDTPPCNNPAHLYAGDYFDNARDMRERGRAAWQKAAHVN